MSLIILGGLSPHLSNIGGGGLQPPPSYATAPQSYTSEIIFMITTGLAASKDRCLTQTVMKTRKYPQILCCVGFQSWKLTLPLLPYNP